MLDLHWMEPSARLPLRWGSYRGRYLAGLLFIAGGLLHLQSSTTHALVPLLVGTATHVAGWWIMPAQGWRRLAVTLPSGLVVWLLLTGPQAMWTLAVPYASWLLVRHRPTVSYVTVAFVVLNGVVATNLFREYGQMLVALTVSGTVIVGSAWLARYLATLPVTGRTSVE